MKDCRKNGRMKQSLWLACHVSPEVVWLSIVICNMSSVDNKAVVQTVVYAVRRVDFIFLSGFQYVKELCVNDYGKVEMEVATK